MRTRSIQYSFTYPILAPYYWLWGIIGLLRSDKDFSGYMDQDLQTILHPAVFKLIKNIHYATQDIYNMAIYPNNIGRIARGKHTDINDIANQYKQLLKTTPYRDKSKPLRLLLNTFFEPLKGLFNLCYAAYYFLAGTIYGISLFTSFYFLIFSYGGYKLLSLPFLQLYHIFKPAPNFNLSNHFSLFRLLMMDGKFDYLYFHPINIIVEHMIFKLAKGIGQLILPFFALPSILFRSYKTIRSPEKSQRFESTLSLINFIRENVPQDNKLVPVIINSYVKQAKNANYSEEKALKHHFLLEKLKDIKNNNTSNFDVLFSMNTEQNEPVSLLKYKYFLAQHNIESQNKIQFSVDQECSNRMKNLTDLLTARGTVRTIFDEVNHVYFYHENLRKNFSAYEAVANRLSDDYINMLLSKIKKVNYRALFLQKIYNKFNEVKSKCDRVLLETLFLLFVSSGPGNMFFTLSDDDFKEIYPYGRIFDTDRMPFREILKLADDFFQQENISEYSDDELKQGIVNKLVHKFADAQNNITEDNKLEYKKQLNADIHNSLEKIHKEFNEFSKEASARDSKKNARK